MAHYQKLTSLDLAALIASRVCHDIISPVGAISNGLEVLDEDSGADMAEFAMDLIRKSAAQASAKLQFARIAFGAAGSAGAEIDSGDAESVALGYMNSEKAELNWQVPRKLLPKNQIKLILNIVLIATASIPRGGLITVSEEAGDSLSGYKVTVEGKNARIPAVVAEVFGGNEPERIDAHTIQPVYTYLLAREENIQLEAIKTEETIVYTANSAV
ncbi:histidine phosphotransferase ChpT [Polycladidibacter stylochi]|uniref:histidine phosphotransferase ChpT n=1 Tax=Polycladidibacter stylochi TaxID=1807766 RepID=UPI00082F9AF4|nr:histidine phosphotransferase family protein [Pseudovibrio stylochi]